MEEEPQDDELPFCMDGFMKVNLGTAKREIKNDWDMVFLVDGQEGVGKSVMAQQLAYYCDPTINLDRIVFTPEEFKAAIRKAEKYQAVIYDEAYTGLSSRGTMTPVNRAIVKMLAEIRQKNLFVFIVMPTFFDLDRYAAIWRSRALIHCYKGKNWERGLFAFYDFDRKKEMYVLGKKMYDYRIPSPNFHGKFYGKYAVDKEQYKAKKLQALTTKEELPKDNEAIAKAMLFQKVLEMPTLKTNKQRWELLGISEQHFYRLLKEQRLNNSLEDNTGILLGNDA